MKSQTMFLTTCIGGLIGSSIGAYVGFKLYEMYGVWAFGLDAIIVIICLAFIYYLIYFFMNRPVMEIINVKEPEDITDGEQE